MKDEIVAEVRKYREENAARFGYNIRAIAEDARQREKTSGHPVVDLRGDRRREAPSRPATETER